MHVDYADVLRQAVDNERWRVLREIRKAVEALPETKNGASYGRGYYATEKRTADEFAADVVKALDRIEAAS
ncbi:hypothetical protein [Oerskovia paurometabola]|uniref:hypothetical protein n=1 Tax=Oerskovia paurometabola TaxID=162170 RepID=UPI0038273E8D